MAPMCNSPRARGFSLVELMVAMTLSLLLLGGVLAIFASSKKTYETTDRLSRIQETGRFALESIVRDLRSAGYLGCRAGAEFSTSLNTANTLLWNFQFPVQGFDAQGTSWLPALDTAVATSAVAKGDAIVIRAPRNEFQPVRTTALMANETAPVATADSAAALFKAGDVVQVSDCKFRAVFQVTANTAGTLDHAVAAASATAPGNSTNSLIFAFPQVNETDAEVVPLRSTVYYLRDGATAADPPSLWRRASGASGAEELVQGVENMQIEYGEDIDSNNTISVGEYRRADQVQKWDKVLAVRIGLLVRSLSAYGIDQGPTTYKVLGADVTVPQDRHLRQVFSSTVTIRNSTT